jgi:hypothetical protein
MKATDDPPGTRYDSLESFYAADPRRLGSREHDIGLWWRDDARGPLHRAAWVSDTGELYIVRLGPADHGGGELELLACVEDLSRLEQILDGWRERCGQTGSLAWLRERAAGPDSPRLHASRIGALRVAQSRPRAVLAEAVRRRGLASFEGPIRPSSGPSRPISGRPSAA